MLFKTAYYKTTSASLSVSRNNFHRKAGNENREKNLMNWTYYLPTALLLDLEW